MVGHMALSFLTGAELILSHRFDPGTMLELIERHRATFTVGAITALVALVHHPDFERFDVSSLTKLYSGGAPIAPAVADEIEQRIGAYVHNIYGLTETTSPSHAVPFGTRAPVDPGTGALSIGVPVFDTEARVVADTGEEVAPGQLGELVVSGPQVVPGYWNEPAESAHALRADGLWTGDVGFVDEDGWFYVVDRSKDQINVSGFKVWPREVEDVLYCHPAVREAAVVGMPDTYRGETVKAFVSLKPGAAACEPELIAFCRERLAAYKYPRVVAVLDELPKTATGKILRRELRVASIANAPGRNP
jgi:long-chain acyl-CoA synthetase